MSRSGISRRELLYGSAMGFGGLALAALTQWQRARDRGAMAPQAAARQVIFLFMGGGPSQMDTFDPKPYLDKHDGDEFHSTKHQGLTGKLLKSPYKFARYGQSGADVSEIFPHLAQCVDRLAIVRSMYSDFTQHPTANYLLHTGSQRLGFPSMGAWINYGLGSENQDLPGFIVLNSGLVPEGGSLAYGNGFLPARYQPTEFGLGDPPVESLARLEPSSELQQDKLALIERLNRRSADREPHNSDLEAVVRNCELAFRMQTSLPALVDLGSETAATQHRYGIDDDVTRPFGIQCLRARKLIEQGVRFVEVLPNSIQGIRGWDQHRNIRVDLAANARAVDKPIAALLNDLAARGLLDSTLVLWGGEFGRTPTAEYAGSEPGRNHNPYGFTMWMAGGGIRPGIVYGATDELGEVAVDKPVHVHDLQATILHQLGIDHTKLTFRYAGRDHRLTDVYGNVVQDLLL